MKKNQISLLLALMLTMSAFAGGIQTNTNQSASYTRSLVRDATLCIDGVYFNPAGLTTLGEGFHISLNNQFIFQNKTVSCNYKPLDSSDYNGKVEALFFPGIYVAYKKGKVVISGGFNPVGGGGSAEFENGLPSFEIGISDLVPVLNSEGYPVNDYKVDAYFNGSSVYFAGQLGVSYQINDMISIFAGARYVSGTNTYEGHIKDIQIKNVQGNDQWMDASTFFLSAGDTAKATILSDQEVDVEQVGTAITPILGVSLILMDKKMNVGIKYEFRTELEMENKTTKDFITGFEDDGTPITMFPDGEKVRADMPAMLSIGIGYNVNEKLKASIGYHYYFDKDANYGKKDTLGEYVSNDKVMDNNYYELGFGLEYKLSEKLLISAGYLMASTGVNNDLYQTDLSYSLSSSTFGGGFAYKINDKFDVNLGVSYTMYDEMDKNYTHAMGGTNYVSVIDTYDKDALIFGIGVDVHL